MTEPENGYDQFEPIISDDDEVAASEPEQDQEVDEVESETVNEEEDQSEEEEVRPEESGYIDFKALEEKVGKDEAHRIQSRINADFRKNKEAERKWQEAEQKRQELEQKLHELEKPKEVVPPSSDDFLDDEEAAQQKLQQYLDSQSKIKEWESEKQRREQELQQAQLQAQQEKAQKYEDRLKAAKLDEQQMRYSEQVVAKSLQHNPNAQMIGDALLTHDYGPQIVQKLASDAVLLQELASLSPIQAGVKLHELSQQFVPKRKSSAPEPDRPIRGGASRNKSSDPWLNGAQFD